MSLSIPDFWKLVIESRLLTAEQCQLLGAEYGRVKGAANQGNVRTLVQWLISQNALTSYQATILEAGRAGPFHYGDYKVYDRIEQRPLAGSFRAIHEPASHPVLLKFVSGVATQQREKWAELVRRVEPQCAPVHPHLNRCFEIVDLTSFKFIATEDLHGQSLGDRLDGGRSLQPADACRIIRQAAMGLGAIHQAGLMHGDIRPHNLWLESGGNIKLVRDPLYEHVPLHLAQTDASSQLVLRADYMAPEFAQQGKTPDVLTDIYALGCAFYQLLTGRPPFADGDVMQKLSRHATEAIQPLEQFGVPQQLAQLVAYMMAKNPSVRYQQVSVVAEQLAQFIDPAQLNVQPPAPPQTLARYENWIKQKQAALATHAPAPVVQESFPSFGDQAGGGTAVAASPRVNVGAAGTATRVATASAAQPTASKATGATSVASRFEGGKKMSQKNMIMLGSAVGGSLLFGIVLVVGLSLMGGGDTVSNNDGEKPATEDGEKNGEDDGSGKSSDSDKTDSDEIPYLNVVNVADDGKVLWAPPTAGPPVDVSYVPNAVRILMIVRPADMVRSSDGKAVLKVLGPQFDAARSAWEKAAGSLTFDDIEQLIIGFHDNDGKAYRPSFVVRLTKPMPEKMLAERWGNPATKPVPDAETGIYVGSNGWSFFVPPPDPDAEEPGTPLFVMGSEPDIVDVAKKGNAKPRLRREITELLSSSDADRHFTVVFAPNALFNDEGQKLFAGDLGKILNPLDALLGPGLQAGSASIHFGDQFYLELRMKSESGIDPFGLANGFRTRLEKMPDDVENYILRLNAHMYWKKLSLRFPQQIGFLHRHTRIGVEDDQAVINAVLPPVGHNLVAAAELAISSTPGAVAAVVDTGKPVPKTIEEAIKLPLEVAFDQKSLEFAMADIGKDVRDENPKLPFPFNVKVVGADLEKNGLTRNQQVRDVSSKGTVAEALTAVVVTAMATGEGPTSVKQKMVWVIGPDPDNPGKTAVLVTTRDAVAAKGYTLPDVFKMK